MYKQETATKTIKDRKDLPNFNRFLDEFLEKRTDKKTKEGGNGKNEKIQQGAFTKSRRSHSRM